MAALVGVWGAVLAEDFDKAERLYTDEVVKRIPVLGPTESPAAHPKAPYNVVDIIGTGPDAQKIQFVHKETL